MSMYQKPFGSIFEDTPSKESVITPTEPTPAGSFEPARTESPEVSDTPAIQAKTDLPEETAGKIKIPFSNEMPQFRTATTVVSNDPEVVVAQSKLSLTKSRIKLAAVSNEITNLRKKISAAKVYLSVISDYKSLSKPKQQEIISFIEKNSKSIKNIADAHSAREAANGIKQATQALDAEIKHWEELLAKKGHIKLKNFRPIGGKVSDDVSSPFIPLIGGKAAPVVKLDKSGIAKFTNYGNIDKVPESLNSNNYYVEFKKTLPSQSDFVIKRRLDFADGRLLKEAEKNLILAQQYDWKAAEVVPLIEALLKELKQIQTKIAESGSGSERALLGLSIVVNHEPELFRSGMLMDNIRKAINNTPRGPMLGEVLQAGEKEVKLREDILVDLQTEVIAPPARRYPWLILVVGALTMLLIGRK